MILYYTWHDKYFSHYDMDGNYRNNRRCFTIYKNSPLREYHAASFGMTRKHCNNFIRVLYPILEESPVHADAMPAESRKNKGGE